MHSLHSQCTVNAQFAQSKCCKCTVCTVNAQFAQLMHSSHSKNAVNAQSAQFAQYSGSFYDFLYYSTIFFSSFPFCTTCVLAFFPNDSSGSIM